MRLMQMLGYLLAVKAGLLIWGITFAFMADNPIGKAATSEYVLVFSPIVGGVVPVMSRLLEHQRYMLSAWLAALAPLAAILNLALCLLFAAITGIAPDSWSLPVIVAILIWVVPLMAWCRTMMAKGVQRL